MSVFGDAFELCLDSNSGGGNVISGGIGRDGTLCLDSNSGGGNVGRNMG